MASYKGSLVVFSRSYSLVLRTWFWGFETRGFLGLLEGGLGVLNKVARGVLTSTLGVWLHETPGAPKSPREPPGPPGGPTSLA